jgi:hypothetical protein
MRWQAPTGVATLIGSLPHRDPSAAATFAIGATPALPAAPQLPRRTPAEGMVAQWLRGVAGVAIAGDGSLVVDPASLDPEAPVAAGVDDDALLGLRTFLGRVAGRTDPVKLQLTGPITLGLALVGAGAPPAVAFPVAGAAVRAHAAALLGLARHHVPAAPLVVFLDEPGLVAVVRPGFPLGADDTIDLLSGALGALEVDAVTGLHCCGGTDWRLATQAGPVILSLPVGPEADGSGPAIDDFLERGGVVAWGAVPTSGPVGLDAEVLWRRLLRRWRALADEGCDPARLRRQALVTPACGLAGHGRSQATQVVGLARSLATRVAEGEGRRLTGA